MQKDPNEIFALVGHPETLKRTKEMLTEAQREVYESLTIYEDPDIPSMFAGQMYLVTEGRKERFLQALENGSTPHFAHTASTLPPGFSLGALGAAVAGATAGLGLSMQKAERQHLTPRSGFEPREPFKVSTTPAPPARKQKFKKPGHPNRKKGKR